MKRRNFIQQSTFAGIGIGLAGSTISSTVLGLNRIVQLTNELDYFKFNVGGIKCTAICERVVSVDAMQWFYPGTIEEITAVLEEYGLKPSEGTKIKATYSALLVDTGQNLILIDTCDGTGKVIEILRDLEVEVGDIDSVILTHGHGDHIRGNTDVEGKVVFPNAKFYISKDEWEFFTNETILEQFSERGASAARKNLIGIKDEIHLIEPDTEFLPGLTALDASGHTPGQIALEIKSEGDSLLHLADVVHHFIHFEYPNWRIDGIDRRADGDKLITEFMSMPARERLARRAYENNALVFFSHIYPIKPGKIVKKGGRYAFTQLI